MTFKRQIFGRFEKKPEQVISRELADRIKAAAARKPKVYQNAMN